jgi:hypothetical protein
MGQKNLFSWLFGNKLGMKNSLFMICNKMRKMKRKQKKQKANEKVDDNSEKICQRLFLFIISPNEV